MSQSNIRVPKSMPDYMVLWAFRYGVVTAMRSRRIYPRNQMNAFQGAPHRARLLADRIEREWRRRHPDQLISAEETTEC